MSSQYLTRMEEPQVPPYPATDMAQGLYAGLARFLAPLLIELDARIDKRLVRTFLQTVQVIITFRDRANGLLLSELGGYLDTPDRAPAGVVEPAVVDVDAGAPRPGDLVEESLRQGPTHVITSSSTSCHWGTA